MGFENVKEHGAVGDGDTDDTSAFEAAISALADGRGGIVYVPQGTYKITRTLRIKTDGITFEGDGGHTANAEKPTKLVFSSLPSNTDAITVIGGSTDSTLKATRFRGFYLEMLAPSSQVGGAAIKVWNASLVDFHDVHVYVARGSASFGIKLSDTADPQTGAGTVAATAGAATFSTSQIGRFVNNDTITVAGITYTVTNLSADGLTATLSASPTFAASTFTANPTGARAVIVSGLRNCVVVGGGTNVLVGTGSTSIHLDHSYVLGGHIAGYHFFGCTYCSATACGSDSGESGTSAYAYRFESCTGVVLNACGGENQPKGFAYLLAAVNTTFIGCRGVGNNQSQDTTIGRLIEIAAGVSYNTQVIGCTDTPATNDTWTTLSIRGGAGNLTFTLIGYLQGTSGNLPKGIGGDSTWLNTYVIAVNQPGIQSPNFSTKSGLVSAPTGIVQNLHTPAQDGLYIVSAMIVTGGSTQQAVGWFSYNTSGVHLLRTDSGHVNLILSVNGGAIAVTQSNGSTQPITWTIMRVAG